MLVNDLSATGTLASALGWSADGLVSGLEVVPQADGRLDGEVVGDAVCLDVVIKLGVGIDLGEGVA